MVVYQRDQVQRRRPVLDLHFLRRELHVPGHETGHLHYGLLPGGVPRGYKLCNGYSRFND